MRIKYYRTYYFIGEKVTEEAILNGYKYILIGDCIRCAMDLAFGIILIALNLYLTKITYD